MGVEEVGEEVNKQTALHALASVGAFVGVVVLDAMGRLSPSLGYAGASLVGTLGLGAALTAFRTSAPPVVRTAEQLAAEALSQALATRAGQWTRLLAALETHVPAVSRGIVDEFGKFLAAKLDLPGATTPTVPDDVPTTPATPNAIAETKAPSA